MQVLDQVLSDNKREDFVAAEIRKREMKTKATLDLSC